MTEIKLLKLSEVEFDEDIYPRERMSRKTVEEYLEKLKAGTVFPPIVAQKIEYEGKEFEEKFGKEKEKKEDEDFIKIISLDGKHRIEAYKEYNRWLRKEKKRAENNINELKEIKDIEVEFWKEGILNKKQNFIELLIKSVKLNREHGHGLTAGDVKADLQKIAGTPDALNLVWKDIAKDFLVTSVWISECVAPILRAKRMSRDAEVYKLSLLGWTQEEIGELYGIDQRTVSKITTKLNEFNSVVKSDFYEKKKPVEEIAEYYHLDIPLTWAILLEDKNDLERFSLFGKEEYSNHQPKIPDVWNFVKGDLRLGTEYEGRLWCQGVMNILYRYSSPGDLVVDPMAGGGVVVDTCLVMNRKCRAYDTDPSISGRKEITKNDIREGYPKKKCKNCDLIILDPPYYKKKTEEYACPEFTKDRLTFLANMEKLVFDSFEVLKKEGYLALLFGQWLDYENEWESVLLYDLEKLFEKAGFRQIANFSSPFVFHVQYDDHDTDKAKEKDPWQVLPISREWSIFKKL